MKGTVDNDGNTLTKVVASNTTSYAWDYENRLTSVTLPGSGATVSFAYDPFGRRIKKATSSATSIFAYDGDNVIEETNSSGTAAARYSQGLNIDEPLAMLRSSTTSFYDADGLGSITSLTNSSGSIAQSYTFDSFGNQTASSGSLTNPFQYTARENDPETGLYYYRARYYDPSTGRFLSEDPIEFGGNGPDFYVYATNQVANWVDPFGTNVACPTYLARWCVPPPPPPIQAPPQPPWFAPSLRHNPATPSVPLSWLLDCIAHELGQPIFYTSTSEIDVSVGHTADTPHGRGEAADIVYPADPDKMLCAATHCGAGFGLDEGKHPSPKGKGPHIHVQIGSGRRGGHGDLPKPCCSTR